MKLYKQLLALLPRNARKFVSFFVVFSSLTSLLELISIAILALSLPAMLSGESITVFGLPEIGKNHYWVVICFIALLIVVKSAVNIATLRVASGRFGVYEADLSGRLLRSFLFEGWSERATNDSAKLARLIEVGVGATTLGFLLPMTLIPSYVLSVVSVAVVLVVAQPAVAIVGVLYFALFGFFIFRKIGLESKKWGRASYEDGLKFASVARDIVSAMKELTVQEKRSEAVRSTYVLREQASNARANVSFYNGLPKFAYELALVFGFLVVGGFSLLASGPDAAIASIVLFAVAGFRLLPALAALNSATATIAASSPYALEVKHALGLTQVVDGIKDLGPEESKAFRDIEILVDEISFSYGDRSSPVLRDVTFAIQNGERIAIVGPSGSGKTTLLDCMLGLLEPTKGIIRINGEDLTEVKSRWLASIGYVSQDVVVFNGTVAQNIALSWSGKIDEDRVTDVLDQVGLLSDVLLRPQGLQTTAGENGMTFSGGQRQRIGIARALYRNPSVLILDEGTSALDIKTETEIIDLVSETAHGRTVIAVAHRLSAIREFDRIVYIAEGRVIGSGSFRELLDQVPEFREQAFLAGIASRD